MSNRPLISDAKIALDQFKMEVAQELGIENQVTNHGYLGDITTKEAGKMGGNIGGEMVRRMIQQAEADMINK